MVESDPRELEYIKAFAQGVAELGWAVGRNVRIEYRWGAGDLEMTWGNPDSQFANGGAQLR
jgi:hypothetical protein